MRGTWKKAAAATVLTTVLVGAGTTAANAITYYPPGTDISITANSVGNRTYVITVKGGVFGAGKTVKIKIPKLSWAKFGAVAPDAGSTFEVVTNAQGGVDPFTITVPEEVVGDFTLTAESEETTISSTFTVTPTEVTPVVATNSADAGAIGLWVAGGAVGLAGIALAGSVLVRRRGDDFA